MIIVQLVINTLMRTENAKPSCRDIGSICRIVKEIIELHLESPLLLHCYQPCSKQILTY